MPTKKNTETTSPRVATIASKLLSNSKTPANVKTVADFGFNTNSKQTKQVWR